MYEFTTISGRIIDARRYMNRWPRLNEPDPAQERWEVWISERSNSEVKLTVASRAMPARCGHSVTFVVADDRPVGMVNLTIGASVNFTRADPMPVLQSRDVIWPVFMSLGGLMLAAFTSPLVLVLAVPLAVLYVPTVVVTRWLARARLQRDVDLRLYQVRTEDVVRLFPKRS
jgi:hypothetical protein